MYSLTNVPHADDKGAETAVEVVGNDIILWRVFKGGTGPNQNAKMATIYVGDHMLTSDNHRDLLAKIGRDLLTAIARARDIGYKQAQKDMQRALGL